MPQNKSSSVHQSTQDAMTVCVAMSKVPCTKVFTPATPDPQITFAKKYRVRVMDASTPEALHETVSTLATRDDCIIVRGGLRRRYEYDDAEGVERQCRTPNAPFTEVQRSWVALDIDDVYAAAGASTEVALMWLRDKLGLQDISHTCQLTSKYLYGGRKANALRVRLWFRLSHPLGDKEAKALAALLNARLDTCGPGGIDRSLYNPVQPHFVNNPIFRDLKDPVPASERVTYYEGMLDAFEVPIADIQAHMDAHPVDLHGVDLSALPPASPRQIGEALAEMAADRGVAEGDRHRKMMGWIGELLTIGAELPDIKAASDGFLRNNGREPTSTESEDAIEWMLKIKASQGALTSRKVRSSTAFGEVPDIPEAPAARTLSEEQQGASLDFSDSEPEDDDDIPNEGLLTLPASDPRGAANAYMRLRLNDGKDLLHYAGVDWAWRDNNWHRLPDQKALPTAIYHNTTLHIDAANKVADNIRTARTFCADRSDLELPVDLMDRDGGVPRMISFRNGLVHLDDLEFKLQSSERRWFGVPSINIDFTPDARCPQWKDFLAETLDNDEEQLREVQKMVGYLLTNDTSHQRIFQVTGRGGTGKGTFSRVLEGVLGHGNIFSTTLEGIADRFGLVNALGRSVMLVTEAGDRIARSGIMTNYMKIISGEDPIEVRVHGRPAVRVRKLPIRIVLVGNMPPPFKDDSDALARRLLCFCFDKKPKYVVRNLDKTLLKEKAGIVNWALEGLKILDNEGFIDPTTTAVLKSDTIRSGSSVQAFADDCLSAVEEYRDGSPIDEIYSVYTAWSRRHNKDALICTLDRFRMRMQAAFGQTQQTRLDDGSRKRVLRATVTAQAASEYGWLTGA